jgi:hypothetical protein
MKNAMGAELFESEAALVDVYEQLKSTLESGGDLPPFARSNATKALAALWQVMNGLDMEPGHLYDVGA